MKNSFKHKFLVWGLLLLSALGSCLQAQTPHISGDWKGNIAFNGQNLRAAEQSTWYPVLYDTLQDFAYQEVTYDMTIHAADAKSIYLNGSAPQPGPVARFRSDTPFPLLLFVGDYSYSVHKNTYLLNTSISEGQASVIADWFGRIKDYYAENLGIPYGQDITLLNSKPISLRNSWMFVTYPTIATITPQDGLAALVDDKRHVIADSNYLTIYAHELAHYYFGSVLSPNSTLRWVFLEGMAEYLSLQAGRELLGQATYDRKIKNYADNSWGNMKKDFVPLKEIKTANEVGDVYRYRYLPILLTALEKKVGMEQMWKWLRVVLGKKQPMTDYDFLKNTLLESGVNKDTLTAFENDYLASKTGLKTLVSGFQPRVAAYYGWGISKETRKKGDDRKPHIYHTPILRISNDLDSLDRAADHYFAFADKQCDPANQSCSSDFNRYDTREEAQKALQAWIEKRGKGSIVEEVKYSAD